jgi:hypothetical protein
MELQRLLFIEILTNQKTNKPLTLFFIYISFHFLVKLNEKLFHPSSSLHQSKPVHLPENNRHDTSYDETVAN